MKRFLIYTVLLSSGLYVGWNYLPPGTQQKTSAFIGGVFKGNLEDVGQFLEEKLKPKNPVETRSNLLGELKTKLSQLQESAEKKIQFSKKNSSGVASLSVRESEETLQLLQQSDEILKQLEEANKDASVTSSVVDRVLDKILPSDSDEEKQQYPQACESDK